MTAPATPRLNWRDAGIIVAVIVSIGNPVWAAAGQSSQMLVDHATLSAIEIKLNEIDKALAAANLGDLPDIKKMLADMRERQVRIETRLELTARDTAPALAMKGGGK
jgi:hypothetical protein